MRVHAACLTFVAITLPSFVSCGAQEEFQGKQRKVVKSDAEWAKQLTRPQFLVTRRKATEPAFSGKYVRNHAKGVYQCVCCDTPLFSSKTKFESGTGWPSFWQPLVPQNIESAADYSDGDVRTEVMCNACGAHLGHVFEDGPAPTGLRYCINSLSLKFVKDTPTKPAATKKKDSDPKAKSKKDSAKPKDDPAAKSDETPKPKDES